MLRAWQLQEAKSKFSELVEHAITEGPQVVTKRGIDSVVVLSFKDFQKLKKPKNDLVSFFKNSPKIDLNGSLDIERKKDGDRDIHL